jgi:hypothetical protein
MDSCCLSYVLPGLTMDAYERAEVLNLATYMVEFLATAKISWRSE